MRRPLLSVTVVVLSFAAALPGNVRADTIVIRQGGIAFDTGDPPSYGFRGDEFILQGLFPAIATSGAFTCAPTRCDPGTLVDLSTVFGSELRDFDLGQGNATIRGVTFGNPAGPGSLALRGTFTFDAPALAPGRRRTGQVDRAVQFQRPSRRFPGRPDRRPAVPGRPRGRGPGAHEPAVH